MHYDFFEGFYSQVSQLSPSHLAGLEIAQTTFKSQEFRSLINQQRPGGRKNLGHART